MRLICPHCGERDRREFYYQGDAVALDRPAREAGLDTWDNYLHLRNNPAEDTRDIWQHEPCGAWVVVDRNTVTHVISGTTLVGKATR